MRRVAWLLAGLLLVLSWLPELGRYRAERQLAQATALSLGVLRGTVRGPAAKQWLAQSQHLATAAAAALPHDPRVVLQQALALLLDARPEAAREILQAALASGGERAELLLNLGRARTALADPDGARRAYLRAAWAGPAVLGTMPASMREALLAEVAGLETELRAGRLKAAPALD